MFKKRIEEHFDAVKRVTEQSSEPQLSPEHRTWLAAICRDLRNAVRALPPQVAAKLAPCPTALRAAR